MSIETTRSNILSGAQEIFNAAQGDPRAPLTDAERLRALKAAEGLVAQLKKPEDGLLKFAHSPSVWMAMRICVGLNVFSIISEKGETSAAELSERTGADEILIQKGAGLYGPTQWTAELCKRTTVGMIKWNYDIPMPSMACAPEWFKKTGFKNPDDSRNAPFQHAFGIPGMEIFPWLSMPENQHHWDDANTFFEGDRGSRPSWTAWFPVRDELLSGLGTDTNQGPLLVDIGGGRGQDIVEFEEAFSDVPGRLVLQDQPIVLNSTDVLPARIEKQGIDFFTESPVPGARIYFMKFIMHDYNDDQCLEILKNIVSSMKKERSLLVINDFILPDEGCPLLSAQWDLVMMAAMAGMERSESQWKSLLNKGGLGVKGMYQPPGDGQGIIVASLV